MTSPARPRARPRRVSDRSAGWLTLTALLPAMTACVPLVTSGSPFGNTQPGTSVQDFMESAGQVQTITLSEMYDRDVSDVVIVCAYTGARAITDELGFDWPGAKSLANRLDAHDSHQAVIALHDGDVVESEVMLINVLYLCDMDLPYPATIEADTTLKVSPSSSLWSDGTTYPVARIKGLGPRPSE